MLSPAKLIYPGFKLLEAIEHTGYYSAIANSSKLAARGSQLFHATLAAERSAALCRKRFITLVHITFLRSALSLITRP